MLSKQYRQVPLRFLIVFLVFFLVSAASLSQTKLYVFDCGSINLDSVEMFNLKESETDVRKLFVPCYLIEHEEGRLLWDGGLPLVMSETPGLKPIEGGTVEYKRSLLHQLEDLGLSVSDIDYSAFSHLHFDHAGAANALISSTILMQQTEWDSAFSAGGYVDSSLFDKLPEADLKMLSGDYDVFGDGTVKIIYAPGHTPGHQVLLVDLETAGTILLSGDLYHFRENRSLRRAPLFNHDAEMTYESMDRVERILEDTGATLWIEHDQAFADTLKKSPGYYD